MKTYRGLHIRESLFVCFSLANDNAFYTQRIGHISIWVLLDNNLDVFQRFSPLSDVSMEFMIA